VASFADEAILFRKRPKQAPSGRDAFKICQSVGIIFLALGSIAGILPILGGRVMDRFVAKANIDHYLGLLDSTDLSPHNRSTITKLLVAEEDKLSRSRGERTRGMPRS
jgi:hypothetical protein